MESFDSKPDDSNETESQATQATEATQEFWGVDGIHPVSDEMPMTRSEPAAAPQGQVLLAKVKALRDDLNREMARLYALPADDPARNQANQIESALGVLNETLPAEAESADVKPVTAAILITWMEASRNLAPSPLQSIPPVGTFQDVARCTSTILQQMD